VDAPYYRDDLALVHHLGFGVHADAVAPGILQLLLPVLERGGLVLELGCGSGLLTRHLVEAGHRVIATDASPAMLDLARETAPGAEDVRVLVMPDDPMPACDAVVSVGHPVSYLPDEDAVRRALIAAAEALRPGGVMAIDIADLQWAAVRLDLDVHARVGDDWAIITRYDIPSPDRYIRIMTTFLRNDDGTWRRDDEVHDNVLVDTAQIPGWLAPHGVDAAVGPSFGTETNPDGLVCIVGHKVG
jgi:SAM-dependent methyltransferase